MAAASLSQQRQQQLQQLQQHGADPHALLRRPSAGSALAPTTPSPAPSASESPQPQRIRKRDRVYNFGKSVLTSSAAFIRSASRITAASDPPPRPRLRKRDRIRQFVERLLALRNEETGPDLKPFVMPADFLEADNDSSVVADSKGVRMPYELIYTLKSVEVFGGFTEPVFAHLYRFVEARHFKAGEFLFQIGSRDDSMYIMLTGEVSILCKTFGRCGAAVARPPLVATERSC